MARLINRAEAWERAHEIFTQVNFNAFDYNTIKESLLDYVKLYYPEDFQDYIESSEFIAILELFAYVGELLAYRFDVNAHENIITVAERKESILRLAKLISYKVSRNIPARGLVKMTSISTTENVIDSAGRNLVGRRIYWNDSNNPDWKEQFILIMNRALEQEYGTVSPDERVQVNDVLFELYTFDNTPFGTGSAATISYSATAGGVVAPMEVVPVQLTDTGPEERRPEQNAKFSLTYANDGLGDGSSTTGFLMFTKQGTLQQQIQQFDGVTPNLTYDIQIDNINETDLWVNNINPDTGSILTDDPYAEFLPHLVAEDLRYGEWIEVDLANAQNIIFNTNKNRHKYEVETLDDDQVRLVFGDGEFSDIPSGTFQLWYRTSLNEDYIIEKTAIVDQPGAISYTDLNGNVQTISFTFSLVSSLLNSSASEDIEHIRRTAPSTYYTQDRMVNGRDYNTFMLQDPTILKLRAVNRTFSGDSKYMAWHDPRESYENVKIFGDDLALYWDQGTPEDGNTIIALESLTSAMLLTNYIEPKLSGSDFFAMVTPLQEEYGNVGSVRTYFNTEDYPVDILNYLATSSITYTNEVDYIISALDLQNTFSLWYSVYYDSWLISSPGIDPFETIFSLGSPVLSSDAFEFFIISKPNNWEIDTAYRRQIALSETTKFWSTNDTTRTINYDTLNSLLDKIVLLKANIGYDSTTNGGVTILQNNYEYAVLGQELDGYLPDINKLSVLPVDTNGDGISDDIQQTKIFDLVVEDTWANLDDGSQEIDVYTRFGRKINNSETKGWDLDVKVTVNGNAVTYVNNELLSTGSDLLMTHIRFATTLNPTDVVSITFIDYVYFSRTDELSAWEPSENTDDIRIAYMSEDATLDAVDLRYDRKPGRYPLNFAWFHQTAQYGLVDPAATNIVDIYIITKGYYTALTQWLENKSDVEPDVPSPLDLRSSYSSMLDNKMISDTVILHPGQFRILFGSRAIPQLQATFKVIRPSSSSLTDNEVKARMVSIIRAFFDIETWEFGEPFYFTELSASIHSELGPEIDSVVLVPLASQNQFGDLFQIIGKEDEIFVADISTTDIEIVQSYTSTNIRQNP
jgi:hypothetical protein